MATPFDLLTQAPNLGAQYPQMNPGQGGIPWELLLANRRPILPSEVLNAVRDYVLETRGGARRGMSGYIQAPTESEQLAEDERVWAAKFPEDRRDRAIEKEQVAFGRRLPTFTQQEQASRSMTPQERINERMGPGWATMDPSQRRVALQRMHGQTPDLVNPQTGRAPSPTPAATAGAGPSMINGMPAQQAIAEATQQADRAVAAARSGRQIKNPDVAKVNKRYSKELQRRQKPAYLSMF